MSKPLIESCYNLPVSAIRPPKGARGESESGLNSDRLTLSSGQDRLEVDYWIEGEEDELTLTLSLTGEPQTIRLTIAYPFLGGERIFFECPECGRRCSKLYLSPDGQEFKCHKHFIYGLTTVNRQSPYGQYIYQLSRKAKVMDKREAINRIWYAGSYTRRYCSLLKMAARAGMVDYVKDTVKIWEEVQAIKAH